MQSKKQVFRVDELVQKDIFPFLRWLPESWFRTQKPYKTWAKELRADMDRLYGGLLNEVRARRATGVNRHSLCDQVLDAQATWNFSEIQLKNLFGVLLEGGSDTARLWSR